MAVGMAEKLADHGRPEALDVFAERIPSFFYGFVSLH
jgi:hypothetical protein